MTPIYRIREWLERKASTLDRSPILDVHIAVVLKRLVRAREFWEKRGLNFSGSRFARYERHLQFILQRTGRSPRLSRSAVIGHYYITGEVFEFIQLTGAAEKSDALASAKRAKEAFTGTDFASTETKSSSRDYMFELFIAAVFARAGLLISANNDTDIKGKYYIWPVSVECKRLQSMSKAESNIRKAAEQLRDKSPKRAVNIIALCIAKLEFKGDTVAVTNLDRAEMEIELNAKSAKFLDDTTRHWIDRKEVDAVFVRLHVPVYSRKTRTFYYAQRFRLRKRPGLSLWKKILVSMVYFRMNLGIQRLNRAFSLST